MVVWISPAALAVVAVVGAETDTPKQRRRCLRRARKAIAGLAEVRRSGPEAQRIVRAACRACGLCEGV